MVADKGKKVKLSEENQVQIDGDLVLSIEKVQHIQDELEKVKSFITLFFFFSIFKIIFSLKLWLWVKIL